MKSASLNNICLVERVSELVIIRNRKLFGCTLNVLLFVRFFDKCQKSVPLHLVILNIVFTDIT